MITKRQREFDVIKWIKSQELGKDACGMFPFCGECDKGEENPCDKASKKYAKRKKNAKKELYFNGEKVVYRENE